MPVITDYLHKKAADSRIPLSGTFELSPVCNFACKMCYVRKTHEQIRAEGKRLRTWQEWLELGRECSREGMLYLLLTGGEPFLYPGFRQLYEQLHQMGIILAINSNGTLIDRETVDWLKNHAPQRVNITLYGASRETYRRVCGNPEGFDRAMAAVDMLQEAGIPVVINASMIPENQEDLEKILHIGAERKLNTRVATYMFPPSRREREETDSRFTPEESARVAMRKLRCIYPEDQFREHVRSSLQSVHREEEDWGTDSDYMRCRAGRSSFWVSWDGSMTACGVMEFPKAVYPFSGKFRDCWDALTDCVRTTPVLRGCAGCEKRELCKPCAAMVQLETGDANGKAEYLCRVAQCMEEMLTKEAQACGIYE